MNNSIIFRSVDELSIPQKQGMVNVFYKFTLNELKFTPTSAMLYYTVTPTSVNNNTQVMQQFTETASVEFSKLPEFNFDETANPYIDMQKEIFLKYLTDGKLYSFSEFIEFVAE